MDIFVARQPVFKKNKKTFGYELLFRDGLRNAFPDIDGNTATSKLLSNTFFSMGIDKITGQKPGLINFTKDLILQKTPMFFPRENIIIEILENIEPTREIRDSVSEFKKKGYTIALDDFIFDEKYLPLLEFTDIIKFDLMATPPESIEDLIDNLHKNHSHITLLAEKVETYQEFKKTQEMGFSLFQGYFFSKPEIISNREIPSNKISLMNLVSEVSKKDINTNTLSSLIKKDVSVSYKLLKFINSAYFNRPTEISTIKDAVTFLGTDEIKKFIKLIAASGFTEDKPSELLRLAIVRARMCELVGKEYKTDFTPEELFTLGLFSLMDAMLDKEMKDIFENISFSKKIIDALLGKNIAFNTILGGVTCFETGNWKTCEFIKNTNRDIYENLTEFYLDAVKMGESFSD